MKVTLEKNFSQEIEDFFWEKKSIPEYLNNLSEEEFVQWWENYIKCEITYGLRDVVNFMVAENIYRLVIDKDPTASRFLKYCPQLSEYLKKIISREHLSGKLNRRESDTLAKIFNRMEEN